MDAARTYLTLLFHDGLRALAYQLSDMQNKEAVQFGYTDEWFRYEFIDCSFVSEQAKDLANSPGHDIEEFKWTAYLQILSRESFDTTKRKKEFLDVIDNDPNEHLWKGAITKLLEDGRFDESWRDSKPDSKVFKWPLLDKKLRAYQVGRHNSGGCAPFA